MNKKTIIIIGGSILGLLLLLVIVLWLITTFKPTHYSFDVIEEKIAAATEKYYHAHQELLPSEDGTYNLAYSTLTEGEYIKPLSEIIEGGETCSAQITVIKNGTAYSYIPYVNCGEKYTTKELYKQIIDTNEIVTTGSGLYAGLNNDYYFRGKIENNYVAFGSTVEKKENIDTLWRIISISNNSVKLRAVNFIKTKTSWDNRYNEIQKGYFGYNTFDDSILQEYLSKLEKNNLVLNETEITKLNSNNLCIGKRSKVDVTKDGSTECATLSTNKYYFSTITPYEYMRASLDENCTTLASRSCSNFNFIANIGQEEEWIITPDSETNYQAYVFRGSSFALDTTKNKKIIYPVITLNQYAFFKSGTGTLEDPYRLK